MGPSQPADLTANGKLGTLCTVVLDMTMGAAVVGGGDGDGGEYGDGGGDP